jgi:hypothetical protein
MIRRTFPRHYRDECGSQRLAERRDFRADRGIGGDLSRLSLLRIHQHPIPPALKQCAEVVGERQRIDTTRDYATTTRLVIALTAKG